jgi:hypothetical protein
MNRQMTKVLAIGLAGLLLSAMAGAAQAAAGQVLFVLGQVDIKRGSATITAQQGTSLDVGDQVNVGPQGRAQLRMNDGAIIALQPSSTLVIEDFSLPAEGQSGPRSSVMNLIKGGLRTITGSIGKQGGDKYEVKAQVALIGVRGTDYRLAWCQRSAAGSSELAAECGTLPDGLYGGVSDGHIVVTNSAGELDLLNDEYFHVASADSAPKKLLKPPEVLETVLEGGSEDDEGDDDTETAGSDLPGPDLLADCHCTPGQSNPEIQNPVIPDKLGDTVSNSSSRLVAHSTSAPAVGAVRTGASLNNVPPLNVNAQGELASFSALTGSGAQSFELAAASVTNLGFDSATGLRWGRWDAGAAQIGGAPADLSDNNLHWVVGPESAGGGAIPVTGSATYQLVGNTNPTDNQGNVGFLGSATLSANFTNQTVTNSVNLGINNQVWSATGSGSIASGAPTFGGTYNSVSVNESTTGNTGSFAGFFTPGAAGAGLSYSLNSGSSTVSGAAAFGPTAP